ncbi:MAG: neutral/alkaline non-lysosomal ceramidase N-terminal domain-containing protein [Treponema sp.]|nr:neutral/alkaline non-lysosomal ceramidase N-terminal domain-containing protein [Treponema sp.]
MTTLGFSKKDITPDFPVSLAGYLADRPAAGIHDRLYARALAFLAAREKYVLLVLDLLHLDRVCIEKLYQGITRFGLTGENLLVCCTHTHSGFGGIFDNTPLNRAMLPLFGSYNERAVEWVIQKSFEAVEEALQNGVAATVKMRNGVINGLGTNRHDPALPCDRNLFSIEFFRADGKKILPIIFPAIRPC